MRRRPGANSGSNGGGAGGAGDASGSKFLSNVEEKLVEQIKNEIMEHNPQVAWDDIAGLEQAKRAIKEMVVWPMMRPYVCACLCVCPVCLCVLCVCICVSLFKFAVREEIDKLLLARVCTL